jgi:hypothetical protein
VIGERPIRPASQDALRRDEAAASRGPRSDRPPRTRLLAWKRLAKGSLCEFATIYIPIKLRNNGCPILVGPNGAWANLPSRPVLDREGRHVKPDGRKGQYAPALEWRNKHEEGAP